MKRTQPYFFSFDVPNPNQMTGHFIVVESLIMPREQFEAAKFTIFPADYDKDKRLRDLVSCAHSFHEANIREPLPQIMGKQITREEIIEGLREAYKDTVILAKQHDPATVGFPDMETVLDYIEKHGLPAPRKQ